MDTRGQSGEAKEEGIEEMKVTRGDAQAMKCLAGKLEIVAADPDTKALGKLTTEYNCKNCANVKTCHKLFMAVAK